MAHQLNKAGFSATSLQGDLSQDQRQEAMDGFRSGRVKILVATDIAARGIDVSQISHVINYDMPDTADAYTHRIGRTGRMARRGAAVSLVTREEFADGQAYRAQSGQVAGTPAARAVAELSAVRCARTGAISPK